MRGVFFFISHDRNLKGKVNESERKRERAQEKDLREDESPMQEEKTNEGKV